MRHACAALLAGASGRFPSVVAVTVVALAAAGLVASSAAARRQPTAAERIQIANWLGWPPKCARIYVSTVNKRWARAEFKGKLYEDPDCAPHASNGVTVLHRKHGKWRQATAGSSFECPVPDVPPKVVKDLRIRCY